VQQSLNAAENDLMNTKTQNEELKSRNILLEKEANMCIRKDDAENLKVEKERLKQTLCETKAAMLTYKNMY
jgi:hypothetical protein